MAQTVDGGLEVQRTEVDLVALVNKVVEAWRLRSTRLGWGLLPYLVTC